MLFTEEPQFDRYYKIKKLKKKEHAAVNILKITFAIQNKSEILQLY